MCRYHPPSCFLEPLFLLFPSDAHFWKDRYHLRSEGRTFLAGNPAVQSMGVSLRADDNSILPALCQVPPVSRQTEIDTHEKGREIARICESRRYLRDVAQFGPKSREITFRSPPFLSSIFVYSVPLPLTH